MRIPGAADIMNAIVLVAVLSALNSGLYVSSRILFRLAERGDAPKSLLKLTPHKVPRLAVLLSSVVGYVAIVAAIVSPQGVFLFLVNASGAVMLFVYLATALAQIRIRRRIERDSPRASDIEDVAVSVAVVCGGGGDCRRAGRDGRRSRAAPATDGESREPGGGIGGLFAGGEASSASGTSASEDTATGYRSQSGQASAWRTPVMSSVAIIGAGFIGLASAAWLMRDGHRVTMFDPSGVGQGASFGNAGTFAHYACIPVNNPSVFRDLPRFLMSSDSPFRLRWGYLPHLAPWLARFMMSSLPRRYEASAGALAALLERAQDGYAPLLADAELASFVRLRECLYLYSNAASFDAARPALDLRKKLGVAFDVLGGDDIRALEPALAPIFARGVLFTDSWHFSDPQGFLQTLYERLAAQGLELERSKVSAVQPSADGATLTVDGAARRFDHVVIATGARSAEFAGQCGDTGAARYRARLSRPLSRRVATDFAARRLGRTRLLHDADEQTDFAWRERSNSPVSAKRATVRCSTC